MKPNYGYKRFQYFMVCGMLMIEKLHKKLAFSSKNFKILFVGNLNYLPNILACKNFINEVLPSLI